MLRGEEGDLRERGRNSFSRNCFLRGLFIKGIIFKRLFLEL
jgi:hypothetical protein